MINYLEYEQPTALLEPDVAKLDNEALLTKFLDVNANFIAVGPLSHQFQEPRYFELRDELCRIDLEIRHRALLGTAEYKAAVKAAHDQAWQQVHIARSCAPICQSQEAGRQTPRVDPVVEEEREERAAASSSATALITQTADQESLELLARPDAPPASPGTAVAASNAGERETAERVVRQETPTPSTSAVSNRAILANWRDAIFALGHRLGNPR